MTCQEKWKSTRTVIVLERKKKQKQDFQMITTMTLMSPWSDADDVNKYNTTEWFKFNFQFILYFLKRQLIEDSQATLRTKIHLNVEIKLTNYKAVFLATYIRNHLVYVFKNRIHGSQNLRRKKTLWQHCYLAMKWKWQKRHFLLQSNKTNA